MGVTRFVIKRNTTIGETRPSLQLLHWASTSELFPYKLSNDLANSFNLTTSLDFNVSPSISLISVIRLYTEGKKMLATGNHSRMDMYRK